MRKQVLLIASLGLISTMLVGCGQKGKDENTISMRNLYFTSYVGGDPYLRELEDKFQVKFELSSYTYSQWNQQVNGAVMGGNLTDVFHANIDSYNFANTYKFWAEDGVTKALPNDLTKWPNVKKLIDNTTNINSLKVDGKLYGIPIAKNTTDFSTSYSPFTYIYRRDWAKQWGVYKENDEYTWDEFKTLLETFRVEFARNDKYSSCYPLADVPWGFPSITNFYKQVPHCFATDATGKYVNNYTTDEYIRGMEESKTFMNNGWYYPDQNSAIEENVRQDYCSNKFGVLYENLSYENFYKIKNLLKASNTSKDFNVDDATAIMKIKGPDGNFHLEGTDNWFSMTLFDANISDAKLNKILDLFDYLLSEDGTLFAVYGIEGFDYIKNGDKIELIEENWDRTDDGSYAPKLNGAKYLRYAVSLGYDLLDKDPLTDKAAVNYLNSWDSRMRKALNTDHNLTVLIEKAEVRWLTTQNKANFSGQLRENALGLVKKFVYRQIGDVTSYKNSFESTWTIVLNEINQALGKN